MRIYEWNIGMAATIPSNNGYNLKSWVIEEIIEDQPDIIVLTEFVVSRGIDYYFKVLEKNNYHWFISSSTKKNGILIALKKSTFGFDDTFNYKTDSINNSEILKCNFSPDFYELQVEYSGRKLSIIGVRIRKDLSNNKLNYSVLQFDALDKYLSLLKHDVICIGDFNAYWGQKWNTTENTTLPKTAKDYSLCTPPYTSRYPEWYSYVMPKGKKVQLDHLVTNLKNKYIKAEYDWSFMNTLRYKNGIQAESEKKISGLPDHAILKVEIVKMDEFSALKILHEDMKVKNEERAIFPFTYNSKDFSCIFLTDIKPMRLYLSTLGKNPIVFEIEIDEKYCAKTYIDDYYDPDHTFKPIDLFEALNNKIPKKFQKKPNYSEVVSVASKRRRVEEADKIYFCGWRNNPTGYNVSEMNIEKTRIAFGDKIAAMCKLKNVSSCWTNISSDENLKKINDLYNM